MLCTWAELMDPVLAWLCLLATCQHSYLLGGFLVPVSSSSVPSSSHLFILWCSAWSNTSLYKHRTQSLPRMLTIKYKEPLINADTEGGVGRSVQGKSEDSSEHDCLSCYTGGLMPPPAAIWTGLPSRCSAAACPTSEPASRFFQVSERLTGQGSYPKAVSGTVG